MFYLEFAWQSFDSGGESAFESERPLSRDSQVLVLGTDSRMKLFGMKAGLSFTPRNINNSEGDNGLAHNCADLRFRDDNLGHIMQRFATCKFNGFTVKFVVETERTFLIQKSTRIQSQPNPFASEFQILSLQHSIQ